MNPTCERCGRRIGNRKNRYCRRCGRIVLRQMEKAGYLQDTYVPPYFSDERGRKGMRSLWALGGAPY